jgi:hypothetical protein
VTNKHLLLIVVLLVLTGSFFAFTKPWHQALAKLGFSAACSSEGNCD